MSIRIAASVMALIFTASGCATGTAHRLPIAGNPLPAHAQHCADQCRSLVSSPPPAAPAALSQCQGHQDMFGSCDQPRVEPDHGAYARCLDHCPGATATDGASCSDPPEPGVICEETYKPNPGGIAGGVVATSAVVAAVVVVSAVLGLVVTVLTPSNWPNGLPN